MPLFDPDTNMLFLAGKGDTTIFYMEVTDKDPFLVEGIRHSGEQTKGVCLVPKRALNVMQAEVNRVLQLTSNMVIPIMYQVPRKVISLFEISNESLSLKTFQIFLKKNKFHKKVDSVYNQLYKKVLHFAKFILVSPFLTS